MEKANLTELFKLQKKIHIISIRNEKCKLFTLKYFRTCHKFESQKEQNTYLQHFLRLWKTKKRRKLTRIWLHNERVSN